MHAIIMAGGSGARLWPLSRANKPKPFHAFLSDVPMIRETADRFLSIMPPEKIWVVASASCADLVRDRLIDTPAIRVIREPLPLGTTLAVGLAAIKAAEADPEETVVISWSDSRILDESAFLDAIRTAELAAQIADGVLLGAKPIRPATNYGYIKTGAPIDASDSESVSWISRFTEKPNEARAIEYLNEGGYLWNTGISVWRAGKLADLYRLFRPDDYDALIRIAPYLETPEETVAIERELKNSPKTAIDNAIYEKAESLAVVATDMGWSDIGAWDALKEASPSDDSGNVLRGERIIAEDTENCMIVSDGRLIATLGLRDLVIVEADDCLLIMRQDQSQRVKDIVAHLKERGLTEYL